MASCCDHSCGLLPQTGRGCCSELLCTWHRSGTPASVLRFVSKSAPALATRMCSGLPDFLYAAANALHDTPT